MVGRDDRRQRTDMVEREFIVPGDPKGKARPVVTRRGAFTPKGTVHYENLIKLMYAEKYGDDPMFDGEVSAVLTAWFPIPKNMPKYKKRLVEVDEVRPTKKPDSDNIAKCILDALNGIAYHDDSAVTELRVYKKYTLHQPCVQVLLKGKVIEDE